jgi:hypothetical protein
MKNKSVSESAFFNPRALIGVGISGIGLALAMFALLAFPSSARATPQCSDVEFTENRVSYSQLYLLMSSDSGCTIYYTVQAWQPPSNPTHSSAIYNPQGTPNYHGLGIPLGTHYYYKALAYNASATPVDSNITAYDVDNTGN